MIMVYSASHDASERKLGNGWLIFQRHVFRVFFGLFLALLAIFIPHKWFLSLSPFFLLMSVVLLVMVLFWGQGEIRGAHRWFVLGSLRFQVVDVARLSLILYLSDALVRRREYLKQFGEGVLPQALILGLMVLLISMQPDLGSAVLLVMVAFVLFALGGVPFKHLLVLGFFSLLLMFILKRDYQIERLVHFVRAIFAGKPPDHQPFQSLIGLGNGAFWGVGLDSSVMKLRFLPEPFTDSIFAILGEEFGYVGVCVVLGLFFVLGVRGFRIALHAPDESSMLLAAGLTTSLLIYAFVNAAVVSHLFPTTGIPMPFISYGGTFMAVNLFSIGMLLNIYRSSVAQAEKLPARGRAIPIQYGQIQSKKPKYQTILKFKAG